MMTDEAFPPPVPTTPTTGPVARPSRSSRRGLSVGLAAGLLGGTAAGLVFGVPGLTSAAGGASPVSSAVVEQSMDPSTGDTESSDETTPDDRAAAHTARLRAKLQTLVDAGTITGAQADAVADHLVASRPDRGDRFEGEGRGRFGGPLGRGAGVVSEALTDLLGLDAADLRSQLRDGATLAEIATAQGVDPQAVIDELVAELTERVDNAVENGRLDQAEADEKLADAEARITDRVNNGRTSDDPDGSPDAAD